jgi:hypothetical protein
VRIHPFGLGERVERRDLHVTEDPAFSSLSGPPPDGMRAERISVPVECLDEVCRREGIGRIAVLKLDVEGGEIPMLRGAHRMLTGGNVRALVVEYNRAAQLRAGFGERELPDLLRAIFAQVVMIGSHSGIQFDPSHPPDYAELLCLPAGVRMPTW